MFLAQGADSASVLIQYGALGALTLICLGAVRVLFKRETQTLDLERAARQRLEDEVKRLNHDIHTQYVPALTAATAAVAQAMKVIERNGGP